MRTRSFLLIALVSLPAVATAQAGARLPRGGTSRPGTRPTDLPPEIPVVARALELRRSRWSGEGYSMFSAIQVPAGDGSTSYTAVGAGTRADFRFAEHFSATVDLTASFFGGFANTQTGEVGTRFLPSPRSAIVRPYFDVRAVYTHANDTYTIPGTPDGPVGGPAQSRFETGRYSGGFGALAGAGFEYSLTNSFALTTELSALRTHMNSYRVTGNPTLQGRTNYTMTAYRLTVGLKYNAVQALHLAQNPMR
jgi:hypothetical protein